MGTGLLGQGNVSDPKAVKEETSNRMLLCPLCNNVTKILMIKNHNLRFRINGFDVCLALLPSHRLPNSQPVWTSRPGVRDPGKVSLFCACVKNTPTNTPLVMGLDGNCTHHTFRFIYKISHTGKFWGEINEKDSIRKASWMGSLLLSDISTDVVQAPTPSLNQRPRIWKGLAFEESIRCFRGAREDGAALEATFKKVMQWGLQTRKHLA